MTKKGGRTLARLVHSLHYRVRYYDFIKHKIEKEITLKRNRRDQLAKDEINLNLRWARNIIMEKDFDNKWKTGELEAHTNLPTSKTIQIITPPDYLSEKAKSFPPPRTTKIFMNKWYQLIEDLVRSPKFKVSHLSQLEMLCEMHEDLDNCMMFIRKNGYSYYALTATSRQAKAYPEVAIANKLRTEIRNTYKQLGLGHGREAVIPDGSTSDDWE